MANSIVLISDEHNPFYSSVYGHPFIRTPNMERLARAGTVFENAYCPSPLCSPSRSAFFSGKRVHELQNYSNCNLAVPSDAPAYGSVLREQGIYTAYFGKTHVYAAAEKLGFSEIHDGKARQTPGDINFVRRPLAIREGAAERASGFGVKETAFDGDLKVMNAALRWLEETAPLLDRDWNLTINLLNPHFPQWNTEAYWALYPEAADLPRFGGDEESAKHPYARDLRDHFETDLFTEAQIRGLRRGYAGNVAFIDDQLGRLLDAVAEGGWDASTQVVYTSDHGEMLGKFGMWWKCSLYEDSVRIPCIAAGPGFAEGKRVRTPVDLHDVQASLFQTAGARRPADWAGSPLQRIPADDPERAVFSEYHGHGTRAAAYLIRKGDWKLIYCTEAAHLLFNLASDPDELHNVIADYPEKAAELEQELRRICSPEAEDERAHAFQARQAELLAAAART
ncbi:sulfatase-like hydrolase/transferase [Paenibacillus sacheonensis]|uniref:Sulfatase-like hydrolase/transferase n=1 Tax=Paenibacillus sacheonensis TaxID=742054 RepID=A0A7X5BWP5_9BACL|nr:sulfatase-like hydrolase/transferase [Paenibacillus sacheonensis]MBM7563911.1 choline-sulfatase [Paenibacillus sacheonensis]NBC67742.1 sulfatase-like hydrolase/transferase [Paenibacillus sacheonensis]